MTFKFDKEIKNFVSKGKNKKLPFLSYFEDILTIFSLPCTKNSLNYAIFYTKKHFVRISQVSVLQ